MKVLARFFLLTLLSYCVGTTTVSATTFYVAANGSDSNNGTSKSTAWLHAPGMKNCSAACASATPRAGDQFVLRGGDTWTSSSFPWNWAWSGLSGSNILVGGLDQTWYAGGSWTRPVLTGGGTWPGSGSVSTFFLTLSGVSHVEVSSLEFTGFYLGSNATQWVGYLSRGSSGTNILIHDNYFHGWSHAAGISEGSPGGNVNAILCSTGGVDTTTQIYRNVIDGWDTAKDDFGGIYVTGGCSQVYQNYLAWMTDSMNVEYITLLHDNTFANDGFFCYSGCGTHNNVMESNIDAPGGSLTYNNLFIHPASTNSTGGIVIQLTPRSGDTSYFFNNVIVDGPLYQQNEIVCADALRSGGGTCSIFNNTEECGADAGPPTGPCIRAGSFNGQAAPAAIKLTNNHWITSSSSPIVLTNCGSGCAVTQSPNPQTRQTLSQANAQGFSLAQTYAYSPTNSTDTTVNAGTNLASTLCASVGVIDAAASAACLSDTTYGIAYDPTSHTVTGLARTPVLRSSTGAWDAGAYQWSGSTANRPNPPSNLRAVVQ